MSTTPSALRLMAAVAMVIVAVGCAGTGPSGDSDDLGTSQELPTHGLVDQGDDGLVRGELVSDAEGECVWIDDGAGPQPVLWPPEWAWRPDTGEVLNERGEVVAEVGEVVTLHGGTSDHFADRVPEGCRTDRSPFVVTSGDGGVVDP